MQQSIKGGPAPFTLNAHGLFKATPSRPSALVFVKDKQAEYLQSPTQGKPYSGLAPGPAARLNRYGNIVGKKYGLAAIRGKSRNAGEFIGRVKGTARRGRLAGQSFDIWGRWAKLPRARAGAQPGGLTLIARKVDRDEREITLRWNKVAEDWITRKLPPHIKAEVEAAIARAMT
jgi:hypothetical protein